MGVVATASTFDGEHHFRCSTPHPALRATFPRKRGKVKDHTL